MKIVQKVGMLGVLVPRGRGCIFLYGLYTVYIRSIRYIYGYTPYISWQYTPRNIPTL
jgi:hypothetical protein